MAFSLVNKKILVTGAGRGLGRELAITLAENGAKVFAVSRTESTLQTLKEAHPSISIITLDLSDWNETRSVLKQLEPMDGLVNNAAIIPETSYAAMETDHDALNRFMQTNLYGPINCIQVVAEKMISAGISGSIVNISSAASVGAFRGLFPDDVAKAGLDMVTKHFALELAANNIRVNSINPTLILTEGSKQYLEKSQDPVLSEVMARIPMKRLPEVNEVVGPILYFLSDLSTMVTGTTHFIDGGYMSSLSS